MSVTVRRAMPADWHECGRICYEAFARLADRHGFPHDFPTVESAALPLRDLIDHPGFYGVVAEDGGVVVGSSFLDERSTMFGIGPVTVDPASQDHGTGRALMIAMLERARERGAPGVRLVQIAYHNRSISLYAKLGFDVRESFVAMHGDPVPLVLPGYAVRAATQADLAACNALCVLVHGHDRGGELLDALGAGSARVVERHGRITAYTTGVHYFAHSVGETNEDLLALIGSAGGFATPGFLVPLGNGQLFRWCLDHGLRVFFQVNLMTVGIYQEPRGAYLPSVGY
jgi:GNAT superfamily N-acetyltransferase